MTVFGTLLFNSFFDSSGNNMQDVPVLATKQGTDPFGNDKSYGATARQTRFGPRYDGGEVFSVRLSGQLGLDLFGGKTALGNGINMDIPRLRWHSGSSISDTSRLREGRIGRSSPLSIQPASLCLRFPRCRHPLTRGSGCRRFARNFHNDLAAPTRFLVQIAAADPNMGDYGTTAFSTSRQPGAGERGRAPAVETRLAISRKVEDLDYTIAVSTHWAHGKNSGLIGTTPLQNPMDACGIAADYTLPFYRGGWSQAQFKLTPQWQLNLAYGIDQPKSSDLRSGDRVWNQTYMANLMYKLSANVTLAWEWRRFLTDFKAQAAADERGDRMNMAIAYMF